MIPPIPQPIVAPAGPACWIISNGTAANEAQGLGLAEAAGLSPTLKRLPSRGLYRLLDRIAPPGAFGLVPPWPRVAIGIGRDAAGPMLRLGRAAGAATLLVQILAPPSARRRFDLIVSPAHDGVTGPNVLETHGALNRVTPQRLAEAAARWAPLAATLPAPRLAVLIGGPSRSVAGGGAGLAALVEDLVRLADGGWSLMATASRRTPPALLDRLDRALDRPGATFWRGSGDNPYYGFLALADAVLVTCDSVNMTSEAATTGKPVHVLHWTPLPAKFRRFHDRLEQEGRTRRFAGTIARWSYPPLDDTARAASRLRGLLGPSPAGSRRDTGPVESGPAGG